MNGPSLTCAYCGWMAPAGCTLAMIDAHTEGEHPGRELRLTLPDALRGLRAGRALPIRMLPARLRAHGRWL